MALSSYAKTRAGKAPPCASHAVTTPCCPSASAGGALERLRRVQVAVDPNDKRPLSVAASEGTVYLDGNGA